MTLPVAAFLRALAPEHGADVIELLQSRNLVQPMFNVSAHHGRGGFGTKRERTAIAVIESVHLLADDVGFFTNSAREQRGFLQNWRANLLIVVGAEKLARDRFHLIPGGAGRGKDVAHALDCFDHGRKYPERVRTQRLTQWGIPTPATFR